MAGVLRCPGRVLPVVRPSLTSICSRTALIKRIEVLKDGASAIYGSEAIGGVVNIILNQEFRGLEIDGRYGFTEKSDIKDKRVSAIVGLGDDKTSIVIGGQYTEQDPIPDRDRTFSTPSFGTTNYAGVERLFDGTGYRYYKLAPGVIAPPTGALGAGATTIAGQQAASATYVNTGLTQGFLTGPYTSTAIDVGGTGIPGASINGTTAPFTPGFNLSNGTDITLDQNRTSLFGEFARELWTDHVTIYGEFLYSHNYAQSQLNAQPINLLEADAANNYLTIPGGVNNPFGFNVGGNPAAPAPRHRQHGSQWGGRCAQPLRRLPAHHPVRHRFLSGRGGPQGEHPQEH